MDKIIEFEFDEQLTREYIELTKRICREDPHCFAGLQPGVTDQLSPDGSFFKDCANRHRRFAVRRDGELIGHAMAMVNDALSDGDGLTSNSKERTILWACS